MRSVGRGARLGGWLALAAAALVACSAPAAPTPAQPAASAPTASVPTTSAPAASGPAAAAPAATSARPAVPTTPVTLKAGVLAIGSWSGMFIAQERGYFQELGLNVEMEQFPTGTEMRPGIVSGQLAVGGGGLNAGTMNLIGREADLKIVADMESIRADHPSPDALAVRKDLWERGVIRAPKDIEGREIFAPGGAGGGLYLPIMRWAEREGIDKSRITMSNLGTSDIRIALANGGIELGFVSEPNLTAGLDAGEFNVLASTSDMYPGQELLVMVYNMKAIEAAGERAGERFMIGYLRGVRDYINAFYYDRDRDAVIDVLVRNTAVKDRQIYQRMRTNWADPNGRVNTANMSADAAIYVAGGQMPQVPDLSRAYEPRFAEFAVSYLGEYQPPR
ncbi:MAG TPA: ABC transporter substrate-binding protein [Chloroflexota bacterium]|nr:ABC transporter substrate-binding protein [Chloroflexota bacterium]